MSFLLPSGISAEAGQELERACVAGGPDNMPWPTHVQIADNQLIVRRDVDESGCLIAPWQTGDGRLMGATATLMEREQPYRLEVELARGKVNQLRSQTWEWRSSGLQMNPALEAQIRQAGQLFGRALTHSAADDAGANAQEALNQAYRAAEQLVRLYTEQVFNIRNQRQPRIETGLGCRIGAAALQEEVGAVTAQAVNSVCVPLTWGAVEPAEGCYQWGISDGLLAWAESQHLSVTAGPLIDFSSVLLPDWLWLWERDLGSVAKFMETYVGTTIQRYRKRIRSWQLTAASNCANVLSLGEDELLWLTVRLVEVAKHIDPDLKLIVGISQPWGEYMAQEDRTHSPFIFADTLIRSGLNLTAVDLELVMGVTPRGSYCRDLLETSRLLDLYAILGVPLRVTMAYPSSNVFDTKADPELRVASGSWRNGYQPDTQADWAAAYVALASCKPYVQAVHWAHLSDADPHQFPHGGLFDGAGQAKPVLGQLQQLRQRYFR